MDVKEINYDSSFFEGLDWVPVVDIDFGGGYDWDEFHAWYSPSQRVYYWGSGSGCSCNSFGDDYRQVSDFENGTSKKALTDAVKRYLDNSYSINAWKEGSRAMQEVATFRPSDHL